MTDKLRHVLAYLAPGAPVPVDSETTALLVDALREAVVELDKYKQPIKTPDWRDVARLHHQSVDFQTMNFDVTRFALLLANDIQQMNGRESVFENYQSYNDVNAINRFVKQHNEQMGWGDE